MTPTLVRGEETKGLTKNPEIIALIVRAGCEDLGKEIRQLQEAIQHERLKLHKLNEDWAYLRRKSVKLDEEICKIDTKDGKVGHDKLSMIGPNLASPTTTLECIVTLLTWPRPHLTNQGNIPYKDKHDSLTEVRVFEGCSQPGLARN